MEEKIIQTKRGLYGRVNITLPISLKNCLYTLHKRTGMKKAEFLRLIIASGMIEVSKRIIENNREECEAVQQPARNW